jgi:hypothetical protein
MLNTGVVKESSVGGVPFLYARARCRTRLGCFVSYCNRKDCVTGTTNFTLSCGKGETLLEKILKLFVLNKMKRICTYLICRHLQFSASLLYKY